MSEPTGSDAHPLANPPLCANDMYRLPDGVEVVDRFGVTWTRIPSKEHWVSVVNQLGVLPVTLVARAGPIHQRQPWQP